MRTLIGQKLNKQQEQLFLQNLDLVYKIACNYGHLPQSHYDDLVQVGSIGLINAAKRYDPEKAHFRTYASHLISSEIKHYLRDQLPVVRPPRELTELLPKVRQAEAQLCGKLGRDPSQLEISDYLGISSEKLEEVRHLEKNHQLVSLDQELNQQQEGRKSSVLEQLEDKRYRSFQLAQEDRILLQDALMKIRSQSRQILEFAFYQDLTQTEIAKNLGISQMQVSRRLKQALKELWDVLNTRITPW